MSNEILNIAIDGPAGSGKSTAARALAAKLGIAYLDTGAMYRSLAWLALQRKVSWSDEAALTDLLRSGALMISSSVSGTHIRYEGEDITALLSSAEVGQGASLVGTHGAVRRELVAWQQRFAADHDAVLDGRDIGTVVLPKATLKIFLTASARIRAERRLAELREKEMAGDHDLASIEREIIIRDERDSTREIGALKQAEDAICLDSSSNSAEAIVATILDLLAQRGYFPKER